MKKLYLLGIIGVFITYCCNDKKSYKNDISNKIIQFNIDYLDRLLMRVDSSTNDVINAYLLKSPQQNFDWVQKKRMFLQYKKSSEMSFWNFLKTQLSDLNMNHVQQFYLIETASSGEMYTQDNLLLMQLDTSFLFYRYHCEYGIWKLLAKNKCKSPPYTFFHALKSVENCQEGTYIGINYMVVSEIHSDSIVSKFLNPVCQHHLQDINNCLSEGEQLF